MKIDLGEDIVFEFEHKGQAYKMVEPTMDDLECFEKDKSKRPVVNLLIKLGAPENIISKMPARKLNLLMAGITQELQEKK